MQEELSSLREREASPRIELTQSQREVQDQIRELFQTPGNDIVLISGVSGVGKSMLLEQLRGYIESNGGLSIDDAGVINFSLERKSILTHQGRIVVSTLIA